MITVANCFDIEEALRLQMALAAAEIPSFIPDEATAMNAPYVFLGTGAGVRVQVAAEHAFEAEQIIKTFRPAATHDDNNRPGGAAYLVMAFFLGSQYVVGRSNRCSQPLAAVWRKLRDDG